MKLRVLTLPFDAELGRFDDEPVQRLLADKDLIAARDHFFAHQGRPYLALVLTYCGNGAPPAAGGAKKAKRRESWRDLLDPAELPLFNTLREWRTQKAKDDGIPPYVICNNRQLAEVVRVRPQHLAKLGEIEGFGAAKLKRYGAEMLRFLRRPVPAVASARADGTAEEKKSDGGG